MMPTPVRSVRIDDDLWAWAEAQPGGASNAIKSLLEGVRQKGGSIEAPQKKAYIHSELLTFEEWITEWVLKRKPSYRDEYLKSPVAIAFMQEIGKRRKDVIAFIRALEEGPTPSPPSEGEAQP